jgi:Lon protease-like protein
MVVTQLNILLCLISLILFDSAFAFQASKIRRQRKKCWGGLSSAANDIFENETPEEREERMKLVRQIQGSFYQQRGDDLDDDPLVSQMEEGVFTSVPLFRVQWTELPGYQNVLNIHVPHYTHMFRKILAGPKPWRFGHVYLPGGSENLGNPQYALKEGTDATLVGTLMQISDVFEQEDGRLTMIVQGVERFQVKESLQSEPFAMATVQLLPDDEVASSLLSSPSDLSPHAKYADDFEEWNKWEILPTTWDDPENHGLRAISPLSNYNSQFYPDEVVIGDTEAASTIFLASTEEMEYQLWIALDEMLRLIQTAMNGSAPIPSQLLGLLPTKPFKKWPNSFQLESYASQLEAKNASIGTHTKSPFVRVGLCDSYPALRRANRLSYAIWILLDSILAAVGANDKLSQQELLELTSANDRLELAYQHLESINTVLRNSMPK